MATTPAAGPSPGRALPGAGSMTELLSPPLAESGETLLRQPPAPRRLGDSFAASTGLRDASFHTAMPPDGAQSREWHMSDR